MGRRIGTYRRLKGLTAEQLASRVEGLTRVGLSKIETGQRANVPLDLLTAIAWELAVSPLSLMYPLDDPDAQLRVNGQTVTAAALSGLIFGAAIERDDIADMDEAVLTSASVITAARRLAAAETAVDSRDDEQVIEQAEINARSQREYLATLRRTTRRLARRSDD